MTLTGNEPLSVGNVAAALGVSASSGSTGDKPISAENLKSVLSKAMTFDVESSSWSELAAMSANVDAGNADMYRNLFKGAIGKEKTITLSKEWGIGDASKKSSKTLHAVCIDVCKDVDVNGKPCLFTFFIRPRTFFHYGYHSGSIGDYKSRYEREYLNDQSMWFGYIQQDLRDVIRVVPRKYWSKDGSWKIATINEKLSIPSLAELGVSVPDSWHSGYDGTVYEWLSKHRGLLFGGRTIVTRTSRSNSSAESTYYSVYSSSTDYSTSDEEADLASSVSAGGASTQRVTPIFCI